MIARERTYRVESVFGVVPAERAAEHPIGGGNSWHPVKNDTHRTKQFRMPPKAERGVTLGAGDLRGIGHGSAQGTVITGNKGPLNRRGRRECVVYHLDNVAFK